jgi:hypothetical protein
MLKALKITAILVGGFVVGCLCPFLLPTVLSLLDDDGDKV